MKWEKITPEGDEEKTPIWNGKDLKVGDELVGDFIEVKKEVGANKSNLYLFATQGADSGEVAVWGSTVLDARLANLEEGDKVRIVYLGLEESKAGRQYKNFDVFRGVPSEAEIDIDNENKI